MKKKVEKVVCNFSFIWQFAIDDFKMKYAGSGLGTLWAFLQPIITIVLYWFVFQIGFKSQPVENFPFILWLISGLVPWFFVSESVSNATGCMTEYSYLVKKVLFNIDILPFAKVISVLLVQLVLIVFTIILFAIGGYWPDLHYLQIPIYLLYMILLATGVSYFTATLYVFFKDTMQIVAIVLQIFFWMTPIVWDFRIMPEIARKVLIFNPVYYIINGYRKIFIYKNGMGINKMMNLYYWGIVILFLIVGVRLFRKCKNHFADVL